METEPQYFDRQIDTRAREVLGLRDPEATRHALPARVAHLWRGENHAAIVPYTGSILIPLGKAPDIALLQGSVAVVVARHEALHSHLALVGDRAVLVPGKPQVELPLVEVASRDIATYRENRPGSPLTAFFKTPINLLEQTGLRSCVFRSEGGDAWLGILLQHYFGDAWSSQIVRREIETLYAAALRGETAALPEVAQYSDYALFQRQQLRKSLPRYLDYWHRRLQDAPPSRPPFDQKGDPTMLGRAYFLIGHDLMIRLAASAREQRVSLAVLCFAAFQIALARWCGVRQIVSAVQLADRIRPRFQGTVGYLLTAIAINSRLPEAMTLREFVKALSREVYDGIAHQDLAFELYDEIFAPPQPFCTPRFNFTPRQESFFLGDNESATPVMDGILPASDIVKISAYRDLQFLMVEYPEGLVGRAVYNKDLSLDKISDVIGLYQNVLEKMASDPDGTIGQFW